MCPSRFRTKWRSGLSNFFEFFQIFTSRLQERHGCHAMMLETIAGVPGMVGGMVLHLRSLCRFEHSDGWIKALLEEAENERMHLMTVMELVKPVWHEKLLVVTDHQAFQISMRFRRESRRPRMRRR